MVFWVKLYTGVLIVRFAITLVLLSLLTLLPKCRLERWAIKRYEYCVQILWMLKG